MIGSVIRYVGLPTNVKGDHLGDVFEPTYGTFKGHVGYVTSFTSREKSADNKDHVTVQWFEPLPSYYGSRYTVSHFSLDRFKVLT
jgi:hypothetical protein